MPQKRYNLSPAGWRFCYFRSASSEQDYWRFRYWPDQRVTRWPKRSVGARAWKKARQAPKFYLIIAGATMIGLSLNFIGLNPIRALYWSAILNGIVATPLMIMMMVISSSRAVVGDFTLPVYLRIVGWA